MKGLEGISEFVDAFPDVPVVITGHDCLREKIKACIDRGAVAYIPKSFNKDAVAGVLKLVLEGHVFIPVRCTEPSQASAEEEPVGQAEKNGHSDAFASLSTKERRVLRELLTGASNRAIASNLGLEEPTVKFHLRRIFRKLGTKNRAETVRFAMLSDWHKDQAVDIVNHKDQRGR